MFFHANAGGSSSGSSAISGYGDSIDGASPAAHKPSASADVSSSSSHSSSSATLNNDRNRPRFDTLPTEIHQHIASFGVDLDQFFTINKNTRQSTFEIATQNYVDAIIGGAPAQPNAVTIINRSINGKALSPTDERLNTDEKRHANEAERKLAKERQAEFEKHVIDRLPDVLETNRKLPTFVKKAYAEINNDWRLVLLWLHTLNIHHHTRFSNNDWRLVLRWLHTLNIHHHTKFSDNDWRWLLRSRGH